MTLPVDDPLTAVLSSMGDEGGSFQTLPGVDGLPHRSRGGSARYYKESDPPEKRPRVAGRVHCEVFDLSDTEQKKRYELTSSFVYSLARQGRALINDVQREFLPEHKTWLIFFEWTELFTYDPLNPRENTRADIGPLRRG